MFAPTLLRDLRLGRRAGFASLLPALFALMIAALLPLALGPDISRLRALAPGLLWLTALLSVLLAADRFYHEDFHTARLAVLQAEGGSLLTYALARFGAALLLTAGPLLITLSVAALALGLEGAAFAPLLLSWILGLPTLLLLAQCAAALSLGLPKAGLLLAVILLPLYAPLLIFGAASGTEHGPMALTLLGAILAVALPTVPLAITAALRLANEDA